MGTIKSKKPVDPVQNPYIGRVDATKIPPPHSTFSLIFSILQKETPGVTYLKTVHPEIYRTLSSAEPCALTSLSLVSDDRPGSTPQNPVIMKYCENERNN